MVMLNQVNKRPLPFVDKRCSTDAPSGNCERLCKLHLRIFRKISNQSRFSRISKGSETLHWLDFYSGLAPLVIGLAKFPLDVDGTDPFIRMIHISVGC